MLVREKESGTQAGESGDHLDEKVAPVPVAVCAPGAATATAQSPRPVPALRHRHHQLRAAHRPQRIEQAMQSLASQLRAHQIAER